MSATQTRPLSSRARYRAGGFLGAKLVALVLFSAACAIGALRWGLDLSQTWGLLVSDGGVLKPFAQRVALGGFVAALGVAFFAATVVYLRFYVIRLELEDGGRTVRVGRLFPYATLRLPAGQVRVSTQVRRTPGGALGVVLARARRVRTRWLSLHVEGRRWPLIIDLNGTWEDGH